MPQSEFAPASQADWRRSLTAAMLWVLLGSSAGWVAAYAIAEHGSIVFIGVGVVIGVLGAVAHTAVLQSPRFRGASLLAQVLSLWLATLALLVLVTVAGGLVGYLERFWATLGFLLLFGAVPALLASVVIQGTVREFGASKASAPGDA